MIKRLRHHLEKDFKHLKHIFACWLAYLILPPVSAELFGISLSIPKLGTDLTELLLVPLLIIWIPLLVQADLTAGKNAFWWTRPISRMEILSAKALYIVIFIICPQLVVNSIYLALKGVVAADIFSAALGIIFRLTVLVLPLWLLAALTTNFKRFVLVVILIPFAGYLFGEVISPFIFRNKYFYIFPQWFFGLFFRGGFILLVNAIFAVILIHQYLTRKTKRSVLLMISLIFTAAVCLGFIQGDFKNLLGNKENQAATELWEESDFAGVSEASPLAGDDPRVRDFKVSGSVGSGGSGSHGGLQGRVHSFRFLSHYSGIPDKFFIKLRSLKGIDVQCSEGKMQAPSLRLTGTSDTESKWQAVRHSFETDIDKPEEPQSGPKRLDIKLGGIPEAVLRRFSPSFGTVTAPIDVYLYRYQIIGRVPLKKGSRCTKESEYVEVTGLRLKPSACIVSVEIQNANKNYFSTHRLRNETIIALHNKKRNETVLQDTMGRENYRYEDLPGQGLAKIFQDFTFSLEGNRDPFVKTLDRDWLEGAELVYLQAEIVGKTTRPFHMKRLIIPAEPGFSAGGKTDRLPLTRITLPENADAAQAKAYLRQVFIASAEKRRRSTDDIEIDMLAEVGPRHIELLGKMGVLYDMEFYAMQAIQRIIEPGSKQQILNILEYYDESDLDGLLAIVCREGWGEAIKPMLIEKLEAGEGLSMLHSWMEMGCVPLTRAEYPVLKRALPGIIRSFNRGSMYRDLYGWMHSLPDFDVP